MHFSPFQRCFRSVKKSAQRTAHSSIPWDIPHRVSTNGGDGCDYCTIDVPPVDVYLKRDGNVVGVLAELLCSVGSRCFLDEEVAVVETAKIAISIRARHAGIVTAVLASVGDEVSEGRPLYAVARSAEVGAGPEQLAAERRWIDEHVQRKAELEREQSAQHERILEAWRRRLNAERAHAQQLAWEKRQQRWRWEQQLRRSEAKETDSGPWAVLGLKVGASQAEIKAAWRKKALQYHPDQNSDPSAESNFRAARAAYEILTRT
jgi:pyruvate/2-oxoglutarate dehydrogenase complex dihydrolipoamide acyltransferase (E2) component